MNEKEKLAWRRVQQWRRDVIKDIKRIPDKTLQDLSPDQVKTVLYEYIMQVVVLIEVKHAVMDKEEITRRLKELDEQGPQKDPRFN